METLAVCFAGHRYEWQNANIENKLKQTIENLIKQGYHTFFDGDKGYFDKLSAQILFELKKTYPQIKIYKVLSTYNPKSIETKHDDTILPEIEELFPKQKIIKRNQWIVDNSDVLICHIIERHKSGAYSTYKYAKKTK